MASLLPQVEHVIREEATNEAYGILELFLELIIARIQMITMASRVPDDLKEVRTCYFVRC